MTSQLLTTVGALVLAATVQAQAPTPATQPLRPPDRPPAGEPVRPATPERSLPDDDQRPLLGRSSPEDGDSEPSAVTLKGCLQRVDGKAFQLRPVQNNAATVTEDVRLEGAVDQLQTRIGRLVEVRGTYEQGTPSTRDPFLAVTRVREIAANCEQSR